jgi:bacterioferritin (cytochrome b1)
MSQGPYPVDNNTYNVMQMLTSKLEAIEAYKTYEKDADSRTRSLIQEMMQQDSQHAQRLVETLRDMLK